MKLATRFSIYAVVSAIRLLIQQEGFRSGTATGAVIVIELQLGPAARAAGTLFVLSDY
jgi:hypothetical protein